MIDLEPFPLLTSRHDAVLVPRFQGGADPGGDRPTEVGHRPDVGPLVEHGLHHPVPGQPASGRDGDGSEARNATRLARYRSAAVPGRLIDMNMHNRKDGRTPSGKRDERVGRVRLAPLRTAGPPSLVEESAGLLFDDGEQTRTRVGRQTSVESNRTVRVGPVTKVPAAVEPFIVIIVAPGRSDDLAAAFAEACHGFDLGRLEQR